MDVLCCIDANFSQKRRRTSGSDPKLYQPHSQSLDDAAVSAMEKKVAEAEAKPNRLKGNGKGKGKSAPLHDTLPVPDIVTDQCERSFTAAQEMAIKASKNFYLDTGLMALLC